MLCLVDMYINIHSWYEHKIGQATIQPNILASKFQHMFYHVI